MKRRNIKYVVKIDPQIAGAIAAICPQESIGRSLSKFIEVQYDALLREYDELINEYCIVSLPVETVDTLKWLYPDLTFKDQIVNVVRTVADLSVPDAAYYREICDLQRYYASGGDICEDWRK